MGFGTGLNALLSAIEADQLDITIDYTSIESDPVDSKIYESLNYPDILCHERSNGIFRMLHESSWNQEIVITERFKLFKINDSIQNYTNNSGFDLIFFDAFAPSCQSELWSEDMHRKMMLILNSPGVLTSYCTQGAFKRTLVNLGYRLDILNGPGKKREMLRALKA